jgi:glutamate-1-semialdehyde 2,1-aminomutase
MKFNKSLSLLKEAKELIPSAAQTYSKSYQCFCEGAAPAFLEKGEGCRVVDIDGNVYLDFLLGLGPVTIGYNNKRVNKAITDQLAKGISFTQPHPIEVKLARKIVDIVPCAQMVKFVKNGSDATTAAIRLARAFTRRDLVLCCGYHGFHDWYVGITSNNKGVPKNVSELTRAFQYNNLKSLETLFQENKGRVAAVIIEPISIEKPLKGKGIANGMPLSLIAGKKEIMQMIDKGAFVSTTFGGETLSIASALETIQIMEDENYFEHTWGLGRLWLENVDNIIREKKASQFVRTAGLPPHSGVVFNDFGPVSSEDFKTLFIQEIISNGIISLGINNFCLAHTRSDVEQYTKAVSGALDVCIKALKKGSADSFFKGGKFLSVFTRN